MTAFSQPRAAASSLVLGAEIAAAPARAQIATAVAGNAGSPEAMRRLGDALAQLKQLNIEPMLQKSVAALRAEDAKTAADWALKALGLDERCGMAWYCLAIAREKCGDFKTSIQCYKSALALSPDHTEIANNLGRLAYRMGMRDIAEKFFLHYLERYPEAFEASNNLACCQRDEHRYGEAIDTIRPAIQANPSNSLLWNTLGTILTDQGEFESALPFFDEALRLDGKFVKARYNRSTAKLQLGLPDDALVDCEAALKGHMAEHERSMMNLARSTMLIAQGRLAEGWTAYEERLSHHYPQTTHFLIDRPRWTPNDEIAGKTLLLVGEQGLGDEVLFANMLPDVIEALGPGGKLVLALEKRLIPLFQRSFPQAEVGGHATYDVEARTLRNTPFVGDMERIDLWAPLASPLPRRRRRLSRQGGLPDRRRRAGGALAQGAGRRPRRPQGLHPVEEPEARRRAAALLLAVRGLAVGADHARRGVRQPAVRRQRGRDGRGQGPLRHRSVAAARHRPEERSGRRCRPRLRARSGAWPGQRHHQHRRRLRRAGMADLDPRRLAQARHRPLPLVPQRAGVQRTRRPALDRGDGRDRKGPEEHDFLILGRPVVGTEARLLG